MPTVSVTRLRLRSAFFWPAFILHALSSARQARAAKGCLSVSVRKSGGAYWTLTTWRDVDEMRAFMLNGSHRKAMPHLVNWCDEASTTRFEWDGEALPSWSVAEDHMAAHGKLSPVKQPSAAHAAGSAMGTQQNATSRSPATSVQ